MTTGGRLQLHLSIILALLFVSAPFIFVFLFLGKFWVSIGLVIVCSCFLALFFLGKKGFEQTSIVGTLVLADVATFFFNSTLGREVRINILFFPFVVLPLIVIDENHKILRRLLMVIPVVGYTISHFFKKPVFFLDPLSSIGADIAHFGVLLATFIILILIGEFFIKQKVLDEKNLALVDINATLTSQAQLLEQEKAEKEELLDQQIKLTERLKVEADVRREFYQQLDAKSVESEARKKLAEENARKESELRVEFEAQAIELRKKLRLEQDLIRAQKMQERILPKSFPDPEDMFMDAFFVPARYLSGDFWLWQYVGASKRKIIVVLGDVMGKAADASISSLSIAQKMRDFFQMKGDHDVTVDEVFSFIRGVALSDIMMAQKSLAVAVVLIDLDARTFEWANAGLESFHYVTREGDDFKSIYLEPQNMAFGMEEGAIIVQTFSYEPGAMLLGYTDGILDLKNEDMERLNPEGMEPMLHDALKVEQHAIAPLFLEKLTAFQGDTEQADDMTFILMKF